MGRVELPMPEYPAIMNLNIQTLCKLGKGVLLREGKEGLAVPKTRGPPSRTKQQLFQLG